MAETVQSMGRGARQPSAVSRALWHRQLDRYPSGGPRALYLGIVVVGTIMLYYQFYVVGGVGPSVIDHYGMSFPFFVYIIVIANAVGAIGSVLGELADRWGRANLVAYSLVVTGALVAFGLPNAPNKYAFIVLFAFLGFVNGIMLVATPALVRDYSPQVGRASAMGFWTLGPAIGSLVVTEVASNTLSHVHFWYSPLNGVVWQDQFVICGIAGLVVAAVAVAFLRELSPGLRDQLMVTLRDRALVEARAKGLDLESSLRHPWRQMLHLDIVGSAFSVSVFLIFYYTMTMFLVIYFSTIFGFSEAQGNSLGNWMWAFVAGTLVLVGLLSDALLVRKPFILAGALGAIAMTAIFALQTYNVHTGYYTFVWILSLIAVFMGVAYSPWMASFTETVERRNPALTATGLAVWGGMVQAAISVSIFILPYVVTSMTPLVTYGPTAQAIEAKYPEQVRTLTTLNAVADPTTLATLNANPNDLAAGLKAATEFSAAEHVPVSEAITKLQAIQQIPPSDLDFLSVRGTQLQHAQTTSPGQWRTWWWVCVGADAALIPCVFVMAGRWSPRRARREEREHERLVERELEALHASGGVPAQGP